MKATIEVSGERQELNLDRVRCIGELVSGDHVLALNPDTGRLCIGRVSIDSLKRRWISDTERSIAPFRWQINITIIRKGIYKIVD